MRNGFPDLLGITKSNEHMLKSIMVLEVSLFELRFKITSQRQRR